MTTRREVPFTGDTLAWVHSELAEIKSRLALVQSAADQSRNLATDAAEKAHALRNRVDQTDVIGPAIGHIQEELRLVRDQQSRMAEDINSLRVSREEIERKVSADAERERQELNDIGRRFSDFQRLIDNWNERVTGYEEINRKNLETASHLQLRLEATAAQSHELEALHARDHAALSRVDQEMSRVSAALPDLHREDQAQKERFQSLTERLSRIEGELESLRTQMGRIDRIDDRLELVQAERSRHGERITDLTTGVDRLQDTLTEHAERASLIEARISSYQQEANALDARLTTMKEQLVAYLRAIADLETDFRKREITAMEKEMRDIRSRGLTLAEE